MQNSVVKNVLAVLVLVVLCFVVGAQAAENAKSSVAIIAAVLGGLFLIWLGPRSWVMIYLLPPVLEFLPMPGPLSRLPVAFVVSTGVLFYWILMWGMGYVKFKWRGLFALDLPIFIMAAYMLVSYIQHPVSMAMFGLEADFVGGKEYVWAIAATMYYLSVSSIPCSYEQVCKVFHWAIRLTLIFCIFSLLVRLSGFRGDGGVEDLVESATKSRFAMFAPLGAYCIYIIYGQTTLSSLLTSPLKLFGLFLSFIAILISGWREVLMSNCFIIAALAFVKRELWCLVMMGMLAYGGVLFLSAEGIVKEMPFGIQRCLSVAPGVEIAPDIRSETEHSSEWRVEMWRWALDSRYGYIKDYTWGDGFGQSVDYLLREQTSMMRGTASFGDQDYFARTGTWHSGIITSIHRLGYVGLVIISIVFLSALIMMFRVCFTLKGTALFLPALFFVLPYVGAVARFYVSAGTIPRFFDAYVFFATIKLFYCVAREQGLIEPWFQRKKYVPMAIKEHADQLSLPS